MSYTENEEWLVENYNKITNEEVVQRKIKWGFLSCQWRNKLPSNFIRRFKNVLNFHQLSYRSYIPTDLLEELKDYWDYNVLLSNSKNVTDSIIEFALKHNRESGNFWRYIPYDKIDKYLEELKKLKPRHSNLRWGLAMRRDITERIVNELLLKDENSIHEIIRDCNRYRYQNLSADYINKLELLDKLRR